MASVAKSMSKTHDSKEQKLRSQLTKMKRQLQAIKKRDRKQAISALGTLAYRAGLHQFDPADIPPLFQQLANALLARDNATSVDENPEDHTPAHTSVYELTAE
jgi:hypothetical protein